MSKNWKKKTIIAHQLWASEGQLPQDPDPRKSSIGATSTLSVESFAFSLFFVLKKLECSKMLNELLKMRIVVMGNAEVQTNAKGCLGTRKSNMQHTLP